MAGVLRKTMVYLGLSSDPVEPQEEETEEAYLDEYDEVETSAIAVGHAARLVPLRRLPQNQALPEPAGFGDLRRITTIHPRSYNDARKIGEAFREGTPVIMNLTDMDDADAKRLVDFSAGLTFGLHGTIERVTNKVFLLSPAFVELAGDAVADPPTTPFNQS